MHYLENVSYLPLFFVVSMIRSTPNDNPLLANCRKRKRLKNNLPFNVIFFRVVDTSRQARYTSVWQLAKLQT